MRAVLYLRVSTQEQVHNYSLDTQLSACVDYCEREGIEVDKVFREEGESAKTAKRPQLTSMLEYCAQNSKRVDLVVVYRVDRFARQILDHHTIRAALSRLGISLRAVQESFDDTVTGHLVENMMATLAQFDNEMRAMRTKDGMQQALSKGRWVWQAPVGYLKPADPSSMPSLIPDPDAAPLVKKAFELLAEGTRSKRDAWQEVTALGLRTRRGKPLTLQSFGAPVRNPIYTGRIVAPKWNLDALGDSNRSSLNNSFRRFKEPESVRLRANVIRTTQTFR